MLPIAPSVPVAAYTTNVQQQPQQFPAWFGAATMSTQQSPFMPYSLEAQAIAHIQHQQQQAQIQQQRYRRPKVYARDLQGVKNFIIFFENFNNSSNLGHSNTYCYGFT